MKVVVLFIHMSVLFSDELYGKPKTLTSHDQQSTSLNEVTILLTE